MSLVDRKSAAKLEISRINTEPGPTRKSTFDQMLTRHQTALKNKDYASIEKEYQNSLEEASSKKVSDAAQQEKLTTSSKQNQPTFADNAGSSDETKLLLDNLEKFSSADEMYRKGLSRKTLAQSYTSRVGTGTAERLEKFKHLIESKAKKYGVDPVLLASLVKQESNFNPYAVSHCGAMGLGQLMPGTARYLGVKDPFNAQQNLDGAAKYIKEQLDTFGGDIKKALAAYNAGPGAVKKFGGIPPYAETQNYVKTIMGNISEMKKAGYFATQSPSSSKTDNT